MKIRLKSFCAAAALFGGLSGSGCEWLQDEGRDLLGQYIDIQREFTVSLPGSLPIFYPSQGLIDGAQIGSDGVQRVPLHTPMIPLDLSSLAGFEVGGIRAIERIELVSLDVDVENNTLNIPIEPIEVRFGRAGGGGWDSALPAAATAPLQPGFTGEAEGEIVAQNDAEVTALLTELDLTFGIGTEWVLNEGDVPEGRANVKVSMTIRVVVVD